MSRTARLADTHTAALHDAARHLGEALAAQKCWPCGCLHHALEAIGRAFPGGSPLPELDVVFHAAQERLRETEYACLGCDVCFPAEAINALNRIGEHPVEANTCPTVPEEERRGWPPLAGSYTVLRFAAPVGVCSLTDEGVARRLAIEPDPALAIVGTLQTENLGIERLVRNVLANPHIRFLLVCGADSRRAIGHLPGQSLVALARSGVDERMRIVGAGGKRPFLRNLSPEAVEHFRHSVQVVNLIGQDEIPAILAAVRRCAAMNPGPAEPYAPQRVVTPVQGYLPAQTTPDPAGYFVIYVDRSRERLSLEHYSIDGVLDVVIEGRSAAELYVPAVDRGLVSRLEHAAYLGRELARAEQALTTGGPFLQDAAPECPSSPPLTISCDCGKPIPHEGAREGGT